MIISAKFILIIDFKEEDVLSFLSDSGRICQTDPLRLRDP